MPSSPPSPRPRPPKSPSRSSRPERDREDKRGPIMRVRAGHLSLVTALALLLPTSSTARDGATPAPSAAGPRIVFESKEFAFPPVIQGEKVTHAFRFKNVGDSDLILRKVETTCGCTVSHIPHDRVK